MVTVMTVVTGLFWGGASCLVTPVPYIPLYQNPIYAQALSVKSQEGMGDSGSRGKSWENPGIRIHSTLPLEGLKRLVPLLV